MVGFEVALQLSIQGLLLRPVRRFKLGAPEELRSALAARAKHALMSDRAHAHMLVMHGVGLQNLCLRYLIRVMKRAKQQVKHMPGRTFQALSHQTSEAEKKYGAKPFATRPTTSSGTRSAQITRNPKPPEADPQLPQAHALPK